MKDLQELKAARPYIRTILAFVMFNWGTTQTKASMEKSYETSDQFIEKLEKDVKASLK